MPELSGEIQSKVLTRREILARSARLAPALGLLPAALAACRQPEERAPGRVQVLVGFGTGNAPDQVPVQVELAQAFEKASGTGVSYLRIPDTDEAQRRFGVLLAAGDAPDVVLPSGLYGINLYLDQNVWLDLAPLMKEDGVGLDLFVDAAQQAARATNYYGPSSETVVGIPAGIHTHTLAYNRELFAKAGLEDLPRRWDAPGWTYQRLLEIARELTRDSRGRKPTDAGFDPGDIRQFGLAHFFSDFIISAWGGRKYDPQARKITVATPEYIEGTQWAADLVNVHHVQATRTSAAAIASGADDPELAAWKSGKIGMVDMCSCDLRSWGSGLTFEWDVAPLPRGPARLFTHMNLDVGSVVARSKNVDKAWELLRFMLTEPDNARRLSIQSYGALSPLKSEAGKFVEILKKDFPSVNLQLFADAIPFSSPENEAWFPAFKEINDMGGQFLDPVFLGKASAADVLPAYQRAAQEKVDAWFKAHKLPSG
jgi:multiple sugar transport system substrate-binding protein